MFAADLDQKLITPEATPCQIHIFLYKHESHRMHRVIKITIKAPLGDAYTKATERLHIPLQNAFLVHCYFFLTATACSASLASGSWSHVYTIQMQAWALHLTHWLWITFFEKFWITSHAWKRKSSSLSTACLYPDLWMVDRWLKKIFQSPHPTTTSYFHNISHSIDHKIAARNRSCTAKKSTTYNEFSTALFLHEKSFSDQWITVCLCCIFQQLMVTTVCGR